MELGWEDMTVAAADNRQQIEQAGNHNSVKNHGRETQHSAASRRGEVMQKPGIASIVRVARNYSWKNPA